MRGVARRGRGQARGGFSCRGARPAGEREGLPPRGGGAGVPSSRTAPAREFQFETYPLGGGGGRAAGAGAGPVPAARAPEVRCPGKEAAEWRARGGPAAGGPGPTDGSRRSCRGGSDLSSGSSWEADPRQEAVAGRSLRGGGRPALGFFSVALTLLPSPGSTGPRFLSGARVLWLQAGHSLLRSPVDPSSPLPGAGANPRRSRERQGRGERAVRAPPGAGGSGSRIPDPAERQEEESGSIRARREESGYRPPARPALCGDPPGRPAGCDRREEARALPPLRLPGRRTRGRRGGRGAARPPHAPRGPARARPPARMPGPAHVWSADPHRSPTQALFPRVAFSPSSGAGGRGLGARFGGLLGKDAGEKRAEVGWASGTTSPAPGSVPAAAGDC